MLRHAYLIMAHSDFYILEKLVKLLDYPNNDIYIHIDSKVKDFDFNYYHEIIKNSNLFFVDRIKVSWGTASQIKCEYLLLEEAIKKKYDYYHLLSGCDLPLKNQAEIQKFFIDNNKKEFVHFYCFDKIDERYKNRVKYYHFFVNQGRKNKFYNKTLYNIGITLLEIQKKINVNRIKKLKISFRNGASWFSITNDLANYVVSKKSFILKHFAFTCCADEVFLQTLVYNSKFIKNLYCYNHDDYSQIQRFIDWKRGTPYTFDSEDYDSLLKSNMLYARKFSTSKDKIIIDKIYNKLIKK